MMKIYLFVFMQSLLCISATARQVIEVEVWPQGAPNSNGITAGEKINDRNKLLSNITKAMMYVYLPEQAGSEPAPAVVLYPGGGYINLNIDQCHQFAKWITTKGIAAIVLKYRLPNGHPEVPITDAEEALRLTHTHAYEWNINPSEIGIAGFSAGGHLASYAATHFRDSNTKPAFTMLFFPVINADTDFAHRASIENLLGKNPSKKLLQWYSNDLHVNSGTPSTVIFCASYDPIVNSQNSIEYCLQLKKMSIPVAMYLLPIKAHGDFIAQNHPYDEVWKELLEGWLKGEQLIK